MPNISDQITREHILQAVEKIEAEGLEGTSQKYEVIINGKAYPPPLVCQYADYFANGGTNLIQKNTFPVGADTRCFKKFEEAGFEIIEKTNADNMHENLEYILANWQQSIQEPFSNHPIRDQFNRFKINVETALDGLQNQYIVKSSIGAGNWASVPWTSILDQSVTTTTQNGIYPVYLFRSDGSGVYLSLGFGTTELTNRLGTAGAKAEAENIKLKLRNEILDLQNWNDKIELRSTTPLGKSYEWASAGAKFYGSTNLPDNHTLKKDLLALMMIYNQVKDIETANISQEENLSIGCNALNNLTVLSKPFILLAGISGTGKSRFVRKQAEKWPYVKNFELVSVRPDWHEPSDLLGYVLRLKDKPEFISTPVVKFLVSAWLEAYNQGIILDKDENNQLIADCTGKQTAPFWLCLDEMNLAPVEQYFADYLSVLETREWNGDIYSCDPLIKPEFLKDAINENETQVRKAMGLKDEFQDNDHDALWNFIKLNGLPIPFNLIVAGTVNMDETTHGFSRKVIDRALSLDFGEFAPNSFGDFFEADDQKPQFKTLTYPTLSHATQENVGDHATATIEFLDAVNAVLKGTLFELAYRALNECLLAVACEQPKDNKHLQAVWDDFLMMKVLPRIEGDEDKLASPNTDDDNLFIALENLLKTQFDQIWEGENRPDLLRDNADNIACRSKKKIKAMQQQLENGFTSFWP